MPDWTEGRNVLYQAEGQSERYNTRAAVVYQMTKMCKLKASPSAPASAAQTSSDLQLDTPYQCAGGSYAHCLSMSEAEWPGILFWSKRKKMANFSSRCQSLGQK